MTTAPETRILDYQTTTDGRRTVHEFEYNEQLSESEFEFEPELPHVAADCETDAEGVVVKLPNHDPIPVGEIRYETEGRTLRIWRADTSIMGRLCTLLERVRADG